MSAAYIPNYDPPAAAWVATVLDHDGTLTTPRGTNNPSWRDSPIRAVQHSGAWAEAATLAT
jgi:hypothetical protein